MNELVNQWVIRNWLQSMLAIWHGLWGTVVNILNYELQCLREDIELLITEGNPSPIQCHHLKTLEVNGRGGERTEFYCFWTLPVFLIFINSLNHQLVKGTVYIKGNVSTFKCKQYFISHLFSCRDMPSLLRATTPCLYLLSKE